MECNDSYLFQADIRTLEKNKAFDVIANPTIVSESESKGIPKYEHGGSISTSFTATFTINLPSGWSWIGSPIYLEDKSTNNF